MAQPIITQVTLSQLNALIAGSATTWNNNYWGTQFYVTDKDWLLHAYKDNICKPVSGRLTIMNGDTLPIGVEPDVLLIDTGIVTQQELTITIPDNYNSVNAKGSIVTEDVIAFSSFMNFVVNGDVTVNGFYYTKSNDTTLFSENSNIITQTTLNELNNYRAFIEFHKSPFA